MNVTEAMLAAAANAHGFIVSAVLDRVRVEGFDPNSHSTAVELRNAFASVTDTHLWLDERRCQGEAATDDTDIFYDEEWWDEDPSSTR